MQLLERWRAGRRRRQLARRLATVRRTGAGLHLGEWHLARSGSERSTEAGAVEPILAWCREVLATCRRPWGIDQFDLVLAWRPTADAPPRRARLRALRPTDLYGSERLAGRLLGVGLLSGAEAVHVVAGLFSWGDAAHAALTTAS